MDYFSTLQDLSKILELEDGVVATKTSIALVKSGLVPDKYVEVGLVCGFLGGISMEYADLPKIIGVLNRHSYSNSDIKYVTTVFECLISPHTIFSRNLGLKFSGKLNPIAMEDERVKKLGPVPGFIINESRRIKYELSQMHF